jgi:hypothetical protein
VITIGLALDTLRRSFSRNTFRRQFSFFEALEGHQERVEGRGFRQEVTSFTELAFEILSHFLTMGTVFD